MRASHRSRPLRDRLARLDDAVVPVAAERVATALGGLAAARARAGAALRGDDDLRVPAEPAALARLDARLARRGPLAVLRAVPGAGAALAAAVALAGGLVLFAVDEPEPDRLVAAASGDADAPGRTAGSGSAPPPTGEDAPEVGSAPAGPAAPEGGAHTDASTPPGGPGAPEAGPVPGAGPAPAGQEPPGSAQPDTVLGPADPADAASLAAGGADLARLAETAPGAPVPALVHLTEHVTPQRAAELVAGLPVRQAVVRVPLGAEQTALTAVPVQRLPEDVTAAFAVLAEQLRSRAVADDVAAAGSRPGDPAGDVLRASADLARRQAAALDAGPGCACVAGLLVTGTPEELAPLAARAGVRGVEPGPPGVPPEQLTLRPVLPDAAGAASAGGAG